MEFDDLGVVNYGGSPKHGLKAKQAQADPLRCLKKLIMGNPFSTVHHWVAAHQDDIKNWEDLSLNECLNVIMDNLAKRALIADVVEQEFISSKFPFKGLSVELDGVKVTGSPLTAFEQHWGEKTTRNLLYHEKHMINNYESNLVWWDGMEKVI